MKTEESKTDLKYIIRKILNAGGTEATLKLGSGESEVVVKVVITKLVSGGKTLIEQFELDLGDPR